MSEPVQLRAAGVGLVLASPQGAPDALPTVVHWGADLGDLDAAALTHLCRAVEPAPVPNDNDEVVEPSLAREHAAGWRGRPGLTGHRDGTAWSPWFRRTGLDVDDRGAPGRGGRVVATGEDPDAGLALRLELELTAEGLLRQRAELTSTAADGHFVLDALTPTVPLPPVATELFDLAGRWGRERAPQRLPFTVGAHSRENRRGRTGPDAPLILAAGTPGFGFRHGEVWALHVAWSGNHRAYAERLSTGAAVLGGGELLLPGEVRLAPGESHTTPWVYAAYGATGLDDIAARFHTHLRARRPEPPPRPVVLNTWEAVYFDQDLDRLTELARAGAEAGVERFVLDDGWFRHRRHDRAGLGDWYVDEGVWPTGLGPLISTVHGLGMEFGLWVEPEMVNPDSDLARAHPDWLLATGGRQPLASRHQQVLDLAVPGAYTYVLDRLDALLTEYDIAYLKWDHNRDLLDAGHGPHGTPSVHAQTHAVYRLLDALRARHPHVEIESCSSGGLRVDLGILERTDRVWASDCIDPLERQQIQRWTAQLLPPELVGAHVGAPRSHTTGRTHDLSFRAGTALFGSFGIEWDLTTATADERAELARWVALYKELRPLLHGGTTVRDDAHDPALAVHGVVAPDRRDALFALVQLDAPLTSVPSTVRLPGLADDLTYRVSVQAPGDTPALRQGQPTPWTTEPLVLGGAALSRVGVRAPALHPEQLLLVRAQAR